MTKTQTDQHLILLAHASASIRLRLRCQLESDPLVRVAEAETGARALDLFFQHRPVAALVDVCLPDRNAFDVVRCIREAAPHCELLLISRGLDPFAANVGRIIASAETFTELEEPKQIARLLKRLRKAGVEPTPSSAEKRCQ